MRRTIGDLLQPDSAEVKGVSSKRVAPVSQSQGEDSKKIKISKKVIQVNPNRNKIKIAKKS